MRKIRIAVATLVAVASITVAVGAAAAPTMTVDEAHVILYDQTQTMVEALDLGELDWVAPDSQFETEIRESPAALDRLLQRIATLKARVDQLESRRH